MEKEKLFCRESLLVIGFLFLIILILPFFEFLSLPFQENFSVDTAVAFSGIFVTLFGVVATTYLGFAAIHRWHVKQRLDNWKSIIGPCLEESEMSFKIFSRLYQMSSYIGDVLGDSTKRGPEKKAEIDRCLELIPKELPGSAAELVDIRLLHILKRDFLFEMKSDVAQVMLSRAIQMKFAMHEIGSKNAEQVVAILPTDGYYRMLEESAAAGRTLAQWQNLCVALDQTFRDWLLDRKIFQNISMAAFRDTEEYKKIEEEYKRVSDPSFYNKMSEGK